MQRTLMASCAIFSAVALSAAHAQITRVSVANNAWSKASTWSPLGVPAAGENVIISPNTTVSLGSTTADVGMVTIQGTLTSSSNTDLTLRANRIEVQGGGTLRIGTQTNRYLGNARIRLLDTVANAPYEKASLVAMGDSTVELHGRDRGLPWTLLAQSTPAVTAGNSVTPGFADLLTPVSWGAGDSVALVSNDYFEPGTTLPDSRVAEFVNPTSTSLGGTRLNFPNTLFQQHFAGTDRGVSMYAEAALMNRNIVIEGNGGTVGGHVMFMGTSQNTNAPSGPVVHLSWTRFENLGNYADLGHYPVHFHLNGDAPAAGRNSVRNCVVAHSQNRSYVIHGTNDVDLVGNIAYDVVGHSIYLEDGTETGNVIEWNLGFGTLPGPVIPYPLFKNSNQTNPAKIDNAHASTFYITNQNNQVRYNFSGSSAGYGFWYHIPREIYPTAGQPTNPTDNWDDQVAPGWNLPAPAPAGSALFVGNVAHTSARDGFFCNDRVAAGWTTNSSTPQNPVPVASFLDFTAYKNSRSGIWHRQRGIALWDNAALSDNRVGCYFASEGIQEYSYRKRPTYLQQPAIQVPSVASTGIPNTPASSFIALVSSTVLGDSIHNGQVTPGDALEVVLQRSLPYLESASLQPTLEGFQVYDGLLAVINTTFDAFPTPITGSTRGVGVFTPFLTYDPKLPGNHWPATATNWCEGVTFGSGVAMSARVWLRTPPLIQQGWPGSFANGEKTTVFYDKDGSLTGSASRYVFAPNALLQPASSATFGTGARATSSSADEFGNLIVMHEEATSPNLTSTVMSGSSPFTFNREISYITLASATRTMTPEPVYNVYSTLPHAGNGRYSRTYAINVLANDTYVVDWPTFPANATPQAPWTTAGQAPSRLRLRWRNSSPGNSVIVRVPFTPLGGDTIVRSIGSTQNQTTLTASGTSYATWAAAPGNAYHYDATSGLLSIYMQLGTRTGGHANNCNGDAVDVFINS